MDEDEGRKVSVTHEVDHEVTGTRDEDDDTKGRSAEDDGHPMSEVRRMMAGFSMSSGVAPPPADPLFEKMDKDHINKYLDLMQRDDDHEFKLKSSNRLYTMFYVVFAALCCGLLVFFLLPKDKEAFYMIAKYIGVFAGGFGAGIGAKVYRDQKKDD